MHIHSKVFMHVTSNHISRKGHITYKGYHHPSKGEAKAGD